uniref:ER membrane protein complex subunit 4 n=1 Tax=Ditylenchus dipsaci TaxID=166011 RepID=A0A915E8R5_9BILA
MANSSQANMLSKWAGNSSNKTLAKITSNDATLNPPGYVPGFVASQQVENTGRNEQQQHLLSKRAWNMALQPVKSLPMNMFMMYMSGNQVSIFPIMMVAMMAWRPMKTLMAVNAAFKPLEAEYNGSLIIHKILFILGNFGAIALAIYKCHSMGLLPTFASDWLDFIPQAERMQYNLMSDFE